MKTVILFLLLLTISTISLCAKCPTVILLIKGRKEEYWVIQNSKEFKIMYLSHKEDRITMEGDYKFISKHIIYPPKIELIGVPPYDK